MEGWELLIHFRFRTFFCHILRHHSIFLSIFPNFSFLSRSCGCRNGACGVWTSSRSTEIRTFAASDGASLSESNAVACVICWCFVISHLKRVFMSFSVKFHQKWRITFNSFAKLWKTLSIFVLSFAEVSIENIISGITWHIADTSCASTCRSPSKSHLFPTSARMTFDAVYRRTSSIHRCKFT